MGNFRVGDKVVRVANSHKGMVTGDEAVVKRVYHEIDKHLDLVEFGDGHNPDYFELVSRGNSEENSSLEEKSPVSLLEQGNVVLLADGKYYLYIANNFVDNSGFMPLDDYWDDLSCKEGDSFHVQEIRVVDCVYNLQDMLKPEASTLVWKREPSKQHKIDTLQSQIDQIRAEFDKGFEDNVKHLKEQLEELQSK